MFVAVGKALRLGIVPIFDFWLLVRDRGGGVNCNVGFWQVVVSCSIRMHRRAKWPGAASWYGFHQLIV